MKKKESKNLVPDPRTFLALLVFANLITFFQNSLFLEIGWICFLILIMVLGKQYKMAMKGLGSFLFILLLQYIILPAAPKEVTTAFVILVNYSRRMFPCLTVGAFMIKVISLRQFILAMRKMHIPQKLIIPISVTIRYFPAIREELHYIKDAMKLRNIKNSDKLEAVIVPFMISATATAEEVSAAAVTRGVENPVKKTSIVKLNFGCLDYIYGAIGAGFTIGAILIT